MPLITAEEFEKLIFKTFGRRKPELNDIKIEIQKYHTDFDEMGTIGKYNQLKAIRSAATNFLNKYPESGRKDVIEKVLLPSIEKEVLAIQPGETPVPKKLHFVWVGGKITDIAKQYISVWKAVNPDYTSSIWFDSRILLANKMKRAIMDKCHRDSILSHQEQVLSQTYTHDDFIDDSAATIYEERKKFFALYNEKKETNTINEIIIEFLTSETYGYGMNAEELQASYDDALTEMTALEAMDISTTELLTSNGFETYYLREALVNHNLAAASDIARVAILKAEGGYYLDVDMLPAVNKSLFNDVPGRMKYSARMWEGIYLESIMKFMPDLIPGYTTGKFDTLLSDEMKTALEGIITSTNDVTQLFIPLGDINCNPLVLKIAAIGSGVINNALASHPDSIMCRLMVRNIINNYSILDEFLSKNVTPEQTYAEAHNAFIDGFFAKRRESKEPSTAVEVLSRMLSYLSVGLEINADATIYLTGPGIALAAIKNYLLPAEVESKYPSDEEARPYYILDDKVSQNTEEESKSTWVVRQDPADERFKSMKKNLVEGALDYDEALDFNEWSLPDTESLTERAAANNWVSAKPYQGRVIVQMQGDSISKEAASNLFSKYVDRAIYIVYKPDGITTYSFDPETNQVVSSEGIVFPETLRQKLLLTMTVVGHGGGTAYNRNFANMTASELTNALNPILEAIEALNGGAIHLSVNLLGCRMYDSGESAGTSYPEQVLVQLYQRLTNFEIWARSALQVSANEFEVRINAAGKKEILDYSGQWVVKEQVLLRDQLGKRYFRFGEESQRPVKLTNDPEILFRVLNDAYKTILDPEIASELKANIYDGIFVGINELKDGMKWSAKKVEGSQTNQRIDKLIKGINLTEELSSALFTILNEKNLIDSQADYYFDLESVVYDEDSGLYNMRIFELKSGRVINISDNRPVLFQYKSLLYQQVEEFKKGVEIITNTKIARKMNPNSSQHTNTLNAAFFLQSILEYKTRYNNFHNLDKTLLVQIYAQLFRNGIGTLQTAAEVSKLISDAVGAELKVLKGLSDGLSAAAVILDGVILTSLIVELKNTSEPRKRAGLQTQIGIASANIALNLGSIGAGALGASTASAVLGYLAVPVAGLSIGLPSLIDNLYVLRESFLDSVRYFGNLWGIQVMYPYNEEKKASIPLDDIVITEIDFINKKYHLGNFYMYSMTSGWGHTSSEVDTFYTAPNPTRYSRLISAYKAMNLVPDNTFPDQDVVVLPGALNRRIDYEMSIETSVDIPLDTDDRLLKYGLQALNNIKDAYQGNFYWRYYALGGYWGITKLKPVYLPTDIKVKLDKKDRTLIIPHNTIPEALHNLGYSFFGAGGRYTVILPPEQINIQFEITKGDVWTINVDHLVHQTTINEEGYLTLKDEFLESVPRMEIITRNQKKVIRIGSGGFDFTGDLNQTVYLHFVVTAEQVQLLLAVDLETDNITASLQGTFENIIANKDKIINAIKVLNVTEITNSSIQFMSSNVISGCVHIKDNNLIVAAVNNEEDGKKVYTIYGNAEEQDSSKYSYSAELNKDISVHIKDETIVVIGNYAYEDETIEYMALVDSNYNKALTSLHLQEKAVGSLITAIKAADDKKAALIEWLSGTALTGCIPEYAISDIFAISSVDKNKRYLEYTLTTSEGDCVFESHFGSWMEERTQFTIFNNGKSHLIISQNAYEDMNNDIYRNMYIKSNIADNLFIHDIIIMPNQATQRIVIEPWTQGISLPALNIATSDKEDQVYMIQLPVSRENFIWTRIDNDLILLNNEDEPNSATVKLRFMDAFDKEKVIRNSLRVVFNDSSSGKDYRYTLSSLISVFSKGNYQE